MSFFNYNGKLFKDGESIIGPANRGLRYGDGLFETLKCLNGRLILSNEHFARLWKGMKTLQFEIPAHFTPDFLQNELLKLIEKNGHQKTARVRLTIIRGNGGLNDAINHFPNYLIETWPLQNGGGREKGSQLNSNGLVLGIYLEIKKSCDLLSNLKHNNYLPPVLAALHAKKEKWNDAILLNNNGRICESTIANIFIIKEGKVSTPALTEGCVAGVLRKEILRSSVNTNLQYEERLITVEDLMEADEIFLTNSINDIRWVKNIAGKTYDNVITGQINAAFLPTIY